MISTNLRKRSVSEGGISIRALGVDNIILGYNSRVVRSHLSRHSIVEGYGVENDLLLGVFYVPTRIQ